MASTQNELIKQAMADIYAPSVRPNAPINNKPGVDITQVESFDNLFEPLNEHAVEPVVANKYPTTLLGWALWCAAKSWHVFPCLPRKKSPACKNGFKDATTNPEQIQAWWTENPDYNFGIALGASNLVVADFDTAKPFVSGVPFADDVSTFTVQTGRNVKDGIAGIQKYYVGSCRTRNMYVDTFGIPTTDETSNGVENRKIGEVRSRGAYVIGPGCVHPDRNSYVVLNDTPLVESPEQNEQISKPSGPAIGTDEQNEIAEYVEAAFDDAGIDWARRRNYKGVQDNGFIWDVICPWDAVHSFHITEPTSSSCVIMENTGRLLYECKHRCLNVRQWKELREWMETKVGHKLRFGPEQESEILSNGVPIGLVSNYNGKKSTEPTASDTKETRHKPDTIENPFSLPESVLTGRLGDIYNEKFKPNDMPLELAFPALLTAASVHVPTRLTDADVSFDPKEQKQIDERKKKGLIIGDDPMVNLYTALISPVNAGKSQVAEWAARALNIFNPEFGPRYLEGKFGSVEMMLKYIKKNLPDLRENFLINPDEWAFMFQKAGIPNSSFMTFMTTSYYRRRQTFEVGNKVGLVQLNHALSFIGGIVDDDFDSVFTAGSLGGLYDRFLFGYAPGWKWDYRPYPFEKVCGPIGWNCVPVEQDGSVFEVVKHWNKNPKLGRIVELCTRAATIMASMDGRSILTGRDVERLLPMTANQLAIRSKFPPNPGLNPDAIFSNAVMTWLQVHNKGQWQTVHQVERGIHGYRLKLGPRVAEGSLAALARSNSIDLWLPRDRYGKEVEPPEDWKGRRPVSGLIRLAQTD